MLEIKKWAEKQGVEPPKMSRIFNGLIQMGGILILMLNDCKKCVEENRHGKSLKMA